MAREVETLSVGVRKPGLGSSEEGANPDPNLKLASISIKLNCGSANKCKVEAHPNPLSLSLSHFQTPEPLSVTFGHSRLVTDGCLLPQSLSAMRYAMVNNLRLKSLADNY